MNLIRALCISLGLMLAVSISAPASAGSEPLAAGTQAECKPKNPALYPRLFASITDDEGRKASPPPVVLPAVSEPELRTLKREFLVRNGYLGPGSKPGADEFEICAPYGLMAVFTWTGGPDEAADEISAVIGIAKRFLVENSGLTGVTREEDLVVEETAVFTRSGDTHMVKFTPQTYKGLTVTDTGIIVYVRGGKVIDSDLHWYPEQALDLPGAWITESEAKAGIVGVTLKFRNIAYKWRYAEITEKGLGAAKLVITPIERPGEGLGIVLEWEISVEARDSL